MTIQEAINKAIEGGYAKERLADLAVPMQAQTGYAQENRPQSIIHSQIWQVWHKRESLLESLRSPQEGNPHGDRERHACTGSA
jgi:hypothetical protein